MHEKVGHRIAIEHGCEDPLHCVHLGLICAFLQLCLQLLLVGLVGGVVEMHQTVGVVQESSHVERRVRLGAGYSRVSAGVRQSQGC